MPDTEPPDAVLADYIRSRLEQMGPAFADEELVQEALALERDLWASLYAVDQDERGERFFKPS